MNAARTVLLTIAISFAACSKHEDAKPADDRSLIVITVDTLRADHMSCYGYGKPTTPNLDRFAQGAVRFERAITPIPRTTEALASLLTGMTPGQHTLRGLLMKLPKEVTTFPERFAAAGFATAARLALPFFKNDDPQGLDQGMELDCRIFGENREARAQEVTDKALKWIGEHHGGRFALWLHYRDPHAPYFPPAPFTDRFDPGYEGPYKNAFHYFPIDDEGRLIGGELTPAMQRDKGEHKFGAKPYGDARTIEHIKSLYDGEIAYTDSEIGRLLDEVAKLGLDRNTVIVFTADHGESLGEHDFWFDHGEYLYDTCLHVPLIVRVPGEKPAVVRQQVGLVDIAPTLLDLFGLEPLPKSIAGRSFADALRGVRIQGRDLLVESGEPLMPEFNPRFKGRSHQPFRAPPPTTGTTIDPQQRAWLEQNGYVVGGSGGGPAATGQATVGDRLRGFVTNTRFKAILDPVAPPDQQLRMYKVDVDPEEVHDISGDPEQRDKVDKARAMLLRAARQ